MYLFLFIFTLFSSYGTCHELDEWAQFATFQETFRKTYDTLEEFELRFHIFTENLRTIFIHNSDPTQHFTMGVNQFTDLTPNEFQSLWVSGYKSNYTSDGCSSFVSDLQVPTSIDWRSQGVVTSVKDQGNCGSCWTFSATGAMESAWKISKDVLFDLSEQELVDCAGFKYGGMGCNGGQMNGAFEYIIKNGQCTDESYEYVAQDEDCHSCLKVVQATGCSEVKPNDQISLKNAVAQQPVAIAIEADTRYFQSYKSGILTSSDCGTQLDHGVLIVGYGQEKEQKYWLVKNSWGTSWGEDGYIKIARSENINDPGICGIAMEASFPIV